MGWVDGVCQRCKGRGIEAATAAESAPSDVSVSVVKSLHGYTVEVAGFDHEFLYAEAHAVAEALRRARQPQPDRAVEALRGLVEAATKLHTATYPEAGEPDIEAILGARGDYAMALRAAKEVLDGR